MRKRYALFLITVLPLILSTMAVPSGHAKRPARKHAVLSKSAPPSKQGKLPPAPGLAAPTAARILSRQESAPKPITAKAVAFGVSAPVRNMRVNTKKVKSMRRGKDLNAEPAKKNMSPPSSGFTDSRQALATSVQISASTPNMPAPASPPFEGLSNRDNRNHPAIGFFASTPDPVGDVGPNHYVQAVNLLFRVYDKTGAPLTPAQPISALFAALGPPCSDTDDGDPIVLYDSFADRWIITQIIVSGPPPFSQCFAVSQTGDPTGGYYSYRFVIPNNEFNDYPKFGVWPDGYYWSGIQSFGVGVFALDRAKILAGDPTATYIYFNLGASLPRARYLLPSDADGLLPPPAGAPNVFSYYNANEVVLETDSLRLYEFHADFATPSNSTFTERPESPVAVAAFDPSSPPGLDDIEQPPPAGSTAFLDDYSDSLMHRLQYRNFGSHESLVVNHTVNVSGMTPSTAATHQAGIRYYELRRAPGGSWAVNEQATFAPDADNRWMGSAAMDNGGNLAVGYSVSSATVFPSIRYAGRLAMDPPNGLFQGENTLQAGGFSQLATSSRWGDYSSMNVDPVDDCTFWYTQEYYAADDPTTTVEWQTKVGNFKFAECKAPDQGTLEVNVVNCLSGLPVSGASVSVDENLYGTTLAGGSFSTQLPPGTYAVSAAHTNSTPGTQGGVVITGGDTTVVTLCITPTPVITSAGSALVAESCPPSTNAIDPGETVTVNFSLKNAGLGAVDTSNLVATLLATGGVTSPSGPEGYGVLAVGGPPVTRPFTFTADSSLSCGDDITATLHLQDGANDLGTVTYTLTTGAFGAPVSATYSSGNITVPIPDLSTVEVPITVTDTGAVDDVNVRVRLDHTFDGDIEILLVHPDGTGIILSNFSGAGGDGFGTGANDCSGTPAVFDDSAAVSIREGVAPFVGSFSPEQSLSHLNGRPTNGVWKVRVTDIGPGDVGLIGCVQLEMRRRQPLCCPFTGGTPNVVAAAPATVDSESCDLTNNAPDPDETVTMQFPLQNVGTGTTNNLVATLLPGGGVLSPSGSQSYGVLSPVGPPVSSPFSFVVAGSCGGTITATLQLQDGPNDLGTVSFMISIGPTFSTFSNPAAIAIPMAGKSAPYPSTISVSGVTGTVSKVTVLLDNFSHAFPADVDVLLVGPGGQKLMLMSDVGGFTAAVDANLTFDDTASAIGSTVITGTFRPTNIGTGDTFAAPAPTGPHPDPQQLSIFNGVNPNGTWSLYVVDDESPDSGSISGGWRLNITTEVPACCVSSCAVTAPANVVVPNDPGQCGAVFNYPLATINGICGVLSYSHPSGSFFPVGTTTITVTATRQDNSVADTATFAVTVNDTEGLGGGPVTASPSSLWPPNHKMHEVTLTYCGGAGSCVVSSITSNEPVNGTGEKDAEPDWQVASPTKVLLRSERAGGGTGRVYTIVVRCTDTNGNHTFRTATVTVPHNR